MTKSPILIIEEFISPLMCEDIINRFGVNYPDTTEDGTPLKTASTNTLTEGRVLPYMEDLIPALEEYYEYTHEGILPFQIEWFPPNYKEAPPRCEGSTFVNGKWCKKNSIDLCMVLFLTDYQDVAPFDETFEAYGGKLEFINHEFSITPKRGTLVVFPANEYFINHTSAVHAGSMYQIRVHLIGSYDTPFIYDPENYKGDYTTWFPR